MKNTKKGFTLIELLVVIAIIGILSTIGLVALNGAREKARDAQRKSDLAQFRTALTLLYDDRVAYWAPRTAAGVPDTITRSGETTTGVLSSDGPLVTEYLAAVLTPPIVVNTTDDTDTYFYDANGIPAETSPTATRYVVFTQLEGTQGGSTKPYFYMCYDGKSNTAASRLADDITWCP